MQKCDRTSHVQKRAARAHIPHTFQNGFRTHTHDRTLHVCVRARTFATHTLLKSKIFGQESTYSKEIFFTKSVDELWLIKKCQNCTFKVNFLCQRSAEFFQKKLRLRPNILSKRLGGRSLSRLMKNFGLGLLTD